MNVVKEDQCNNVHLVYKTYYGILQWIKKNVVNNQGNKFYSPITLKGNTILERIQMKDLQVSNQRM